VVTGAGVRVGRAIAEALGAAGADVVVHYATSAEGAEATAAAVRAAGRRAVLVQADLRDSAEVARLFEAAEGLGGCDLLVNSAAVFERLPVERIDDAAWRRMLDTNLTAPFFCARAAVTPMRRKGRGDIVNIVDVGGGLRAWKGYAHYCAAKAGLRMLTEVLALELAPVIRVNAIAPGAVMLPEETSEEEAARLVGRIPAGRLGSPDDVTQTLLFLVAGPRFVTGQMIAVDGGRSIA